MLPILELKSEFLNALREHSRIILQAPTGSGKSTQIPQILWKHRFAEDGEIVILQPRRLPTRVLAKRVAEELKVKLGNEVGYQMRFERVISSQTKIRFVTEGTLLRQMMDDPKLHGIRILIFDEYHERHLHTDIALALARQLTQTTRPDLKLIVMSATLDTVQLEEYLKPCRILTSSGRTYPVEIRYQKKTGQNKQPWETALETLESVVDTTEGDILIFQSGAREIHQTIRAIQSSRKCRDLIPLPLYGELSPQDQDLALASQAKRKVIVSTNVAETSLTIDGIRIVIDSGLARIPRFDPVRGINTLLIEKISQASAEQRAGRAGRTAPGLCIRLWTEKEHSSRPPQTTPEILRVDLSESVLVLKAAGVPDVAAFPWLQPPSAQSLNRSLTLLQNLGALEEQQEYLTELGKRLLAFPLHPRYARMFLEAESLGCVREIAVIAALAQGRSVLLRSTGRTMDNAREDILGEEHLSDFFLQLRAWEFALEHNFSVEACQPLGIHAQTARQVLATTNQFLRLANSIGIRTEKTVATKKAVARCLLLGFSDQLARRLDSGTLRCEMVHRRRGTLARESCIRNAPLFIASEVNEIGTTGAEQTVLLSMATAIEKNWLKELFPNDFKTERTTYFDVSLRRVIAREAILFRDLVLEEGKALEPFANDAATALADAVEKGLCKLEHWDEKVEQWIVRLQCVAKWFPKAEIPTIGETERHTLIEQLCYGATSEREIRNRPVLPVIRDWLAPAQSAFLETHAPEFLKLPNGRRAKVIYAIDAPPTIAQRIQDLYDIKTGLTIGGRIPVLIQVLAPNFRPVQITDNLQTFWQDTYPKLKPQLQRRYPKHQWI